MIYLHYVLSMFDVNIQDKWQKIRQSWITPLYKVASSSFWMLNTCCETQVLMSEQNTLYVSWHVITSFACAIRQFWQLVWIQRDACNLSAWLTPLYLLPGSFSYSCLWFVVSFRSFPSVASSLCEFSPSRYCRIRLRISIAEMFLATFFLRENKCIQQINLS